MLNELVFRGVARVFKDYGTPMQEAATYSKHRLIDEFIEKLGIRWNEPFTLIEASEPPAALVEWVSRHKDQLLVLFKSQFSFKHKTPTLIDYFKWCERIVESVMPKIWKVARTHRPMPPKPPRKKKRRLPTNPPNPPNTPSAPISNASNTPSSANTPNASREATSDKPTSKRPRHYFYEWNLDGNCGLLQCYQAHVELKSKQSRNADIS